MSDQNDIIARNILVRMQAAGWNRQRLAQEAHLTWALADIYTKGKFGPRGPAMNVLDRIAAALGCTVAELMRPGERRRT